MSIAAAATEAVLSLPEYKNARCIGVYLSMPQGEVATKAIVLDAFRHGKQIFVPYLCTGKVQDHPDSRSTMNMVSLNSKSDYEALRSDIWGIPTVTENSLPERSRILEDLGFSSDNTPQDIADNQLSSRTKGKEYNMLDLIIMPGLAFDGGLGRLGHGKGYYDYFLKRYRDLKICTLEKELNMPFLGTCQRLRFRAGLAQPDSYSPSWTSPRCAVYDGQNSHRCF